MVLTKKLSEFTEAPLTNADTEIVGLENGANVKKLYPTSWNTAGRPAMPFNGLLGFNTDLIAYEFFDTVNNVWKQLATV